MQVEEGDGMIQEVQDNQSWIKDNRYISQIAQFASRTYNLQDLHQLLIDMAGQDILNKHRGVIGVRKILSASELETVEVVIDAGIIPKLIVFLNQKQFPQLPQESAWALAYILIQDTEKIIEVFRHGGAQLLPKLLKTNKFQIADKTIKTISNLAAKSAAYRDEIIQIGGITQLAKFVKDKYKPSLIEDCFWAINDLCNGTPAPLSDKIQVGINCLCKSIVKDKVQDRDLLKACLQTLNTNFDSLINCKDQYLIMFIHRIAKISQQTSRQLLPCKILAIKMIGKFCKEGKISCLISFGILKIMKENLKHSKITVRQLSCYVIGKIAAGTQSQVYSIIKQHQLITLLLDMFENDHNRVRRQICIIFSHLYYYGEPNDIFHLYQSKNIVKYYYLMLKEEAKTAQIAMQYLFWILTFANEFADNLKNSLTKELQRLGAEPMLQKWQCSQVDTIVDNAKRILAFLS